MCGGVIGCHNDDDDEEEDDRGRGGGIGHDRMQDTVIVRAHTSRQRWPER